MRNRYYDELAAPPQKVAGQPLRAAVAQPADCAGPDRARQTDQELVRRYLDGNKSAFDQLFIRYEYKIRGLVLRYLRDPVEVQDVVQEAFIRALRALPEFRGESAFYTWLYRIAVNTVKNHVVAKQRRPPCVDVDVEDAQYRDSAASLRGGEDPAEVLARDQLSREIQGALSALPNDLRCALTLRELDGLSYKQIASILECPVGTVRSRIFRARAAIDARIRPLLEN